MARTVFDVLKQNIGDQIAASSEFLAAGGAKDFAQYRETVGLIRGLEASLQYVADLSRNLENDDDD
jgi:hypothetical protein